MLRRERPGASARSHTTGIAPEERARNGTTTLLAALNVLDGQIIRQCQQRHTHVECLQFLKEIDRETPKDKTLHLIADDDATHKHPGVREWLARHPRFVPTVVAGGSPRPEGDPAVVNKRPQDGETPPDGGDGGRTGFGNTQRGW